MANQPDDAVVTREHRSVELMERMRDDDPQALEGLLSLFWEPLMGYAVGFVSSVDAAEDVVQQTFIKCWERRARWRSTGTVQGYLYRIARNLALNEQRRRRIRLKWVERGERANRLRAPDPGQTLDESRLRDTVEEGIQALPSRRREVFVLARFHNFSYREIAELMGISPQTVANQMSTALADLRRSLADVLEKTEN